MLYLGLLGRGRSKSYKEHRGCTQDYGVNTVGAQKTTDCAKLIEELHRLASIQS